MTDLFNLNDIDDTGVEKAADFVSGRTIHPSDIYDCIITSAYGELYNNDKNRKVIKLELQPVVEGNTDAFPHSLWITDKATGFIYKEKDSKDSKTGETKKTKVPVYGYSRADEINRILMGKKFAGNAKTEMKEIQLWNFEEKKNTPQMKAVFTEWVGKTIGVGVLQEKQDVVRQGAKTGKTRELNTADKFFTAKTHFTANEVENSSKEPRTAKTWLERNKGKVKDTSTVKEGNAPSELETQNSEALDKLFS